MILILTLGVIIGLGIGFSIASQQDWTPVWADVDGWEYTYKYYPSVNAGTTKVIYTIYYSESRNRYKLICKGDRPKEHSYYIKAVNKLNELNIQLDTQKRNSRVTDEQ
jgi:hypothetical protein